MRRHPANRDGQPRKEPPRQRLTDRPRLKNGRLSRAPKVSLEARYKLKEPSVKAKAGKMAKKQ
jgi:hypothetical protein